MKLNVFIKLVNINLEQVKFYRQLKGGYWLYLANMWAETTKEKYETFSQADSIHISCLDESQSGNIYTEKWRRK